MRLLSEIQKDMEATIHEITQRYNLKDLFEVDHKAGLSEALRIANEEYGVDYKKEWNETYENFKDLLESILPQLVINYDLYDMYCKNPNAAIDEVIKKLDEEETLDKKYGGLLKLFDKKKIIEFLDLINNLSDKEFEDFGVMYVSYAVHLFESMINQYLQEELTVNFELSISTINNILSKKLNLEDKLDWFLIIVSGNSFVESKEWPVIKKYISIRNYFVHYKPDDHQNFSKNEQYLKKSVAIEFLNATIECSKFLYTNSSKKLKKHRNKLESVRKQFIKDSSHLKPI